jgi:hypothetical protein
MWAIQAHRKNIRQTQKARAATKVVVVENQIPVGDRYLKVKIILKVYIIVKNQKYE